MDRSCRSPLRRFAAALIGAGLATATLVALASAPASAQAWRPDVTSCRSATGTGGACGTLADFTGGWRPVVGPGGAQVYATAFGTGLDSGESGSVHVLDRNAGTGALTPRPGAAGCIGNTPTPACADGRALRNADDIAIGSDGRHVYVSGWTGTVAVFDRDPGSGALTQKPGAQGCIATGGADGCTAGRAIGGRGLALSPDGRQLYVAGRRTLAILDRDPGTGALSQKAGTAGCFAGGGAEGCADPRALGDARQLALSGDGANLYLPSEESRGVLVFDRDPGTGTLVQKAGAAGCVTANGAAGCAQAPQLATAQVALAGPDGRQVYVTHAAGVVTFTRAGDGTLRFQSCVNGGGSDGCGAGGQVDDLGYAAVSPDGGSVVAAHVEASGFSIFTRDGNGNLARQSGSGGCLTRTGDGGACSAHPAAGATGRLDFAGGDQLYAGFYGASSLLTIARRPDLSGGGAGGDGAAGSGADGGAGGRSGGPGVGRGRGRSTGRVRAQLTVRWRVRDRRTTLTKLLVTRVPRGGVVQLRCSGRACPFRQRRAARARRGRVDALKAIPARRRTLAVGQTLEVRVSVPRLIGKVTRFTIRRGRRPSSVSLCTRPGVARAQRRC